MLLLIDSVPYILRQIQTLNISIIYSNRRNKEFTPLMTINSEILLRNKSPEFFRIQINTIFTDMYPMKNNVSFLRALFVYAF